MQKRLFFVLLAILQLNIVFAQKNNSALLNVNHPYLFFSEKDLPEIRERLTREPFLTRWKVFKQNAENVLKTPVQYSNAQTKQFTSPRKYLENAGITSFAYIITREEKYAKRAIEEAMAMAEGVMTEANGDLVWYYPQFNSWNKGADLGTAELSQAMAMIYDWCYDAMTNEEREKIKNALIHKGINRYLKSVEGETPDSWVQNPVSNWAGVVSGGMGLGALAIYNESEKARRTVEYSHKYVSAFLDHVFLEDGGGHEGVMYARYGELFSIYYLIAYQRLFGLDLRLLESFNRKLAGYWDVHMRGPDMKYANFNNMNETTFEGLWGKDRGIEGGPSSDLNALLETLSPGGDPLLLWAADNGAPPHNWLGASAMYFLWRRGDAKPVAPDEKPKLQDAVLFRGAGHTIFQSGNLWMAYNSGWISNRSHSNMDLGSFVLVVDKERFVNDPGYNDVPAWKHSTIVVNGEDQISGKAGKYLNFGSGDSFHYLASDLSKAYNPDNVKKFIRHVLMLKEKYIVILDELTVKESAELEWRLQTRKKAEVFNSENAIIKGIDYQLLVMNAADNTKTEVIPWEGNNGKLNAIRKIPAQHGAEHLIVTVLYPQNKENQLEKTPEAKFSNGVLKVTGSDGNEDNISFRKTENRWVLTSVNEEKNLTIPDGNERTLKPFRNTENAGIEIDSLPSWFLEF